MECGDKVLAGLRLGGDEGDDRGLRVREYVNVGEPRCPLDDVKCEYRAHDLRLEPCNLNGSEIMITSQNPGHAVQNVCYYVLRPAYL